MTLLSTAQLVLMDAASIINVAPIFNAIPAVRALHVSTAAALMDIAALNINVRLLLDQASTSV